MDGSADLSRIRKTNLHEIQVVELRHMVGSIVLYAGPLRKPSACLVIPSDYLVLQSYSLLNY